MKERVFISYVRLAGIDIPVKDIEQKLSKGQFYLYTSRGAYRITEDFKAVFVEDGGFTRKGRYCISSSQYLKKESSARKYMKSMAEAVKKSESSLYKGQEGHKRLARECGVALLDFDSQERLEVLHESYFEIYYRGIGLEEMLLSEAEWKNLMLQGEADAGKVAI